MTDKFYMISPENEFVDCVRGVVYRIPLACDFRCTGQTGRCLNA